MAVKILLTGPPGCGKTTLVMRLVDQLRGLRLAGFYTQERRDRDGRRTGFQAVGLNGGSTALADVRSKSNVRVGKYGVELAGFERLILDELTRQGTDVDLVVIDEIGKMECSSKRFIELAVRLLDSDTPVVATVAMKGGGFIAEVKRRSDMQLIVVQAGNRDHLVSDLADRVRTAVR